MKERFRLLNAFFKNTLNLAGDLVIMNLLLFVSFIPIITIGAAASAGYAGMYRTIQKQETGLLFKRYFADFRASWRQATVGWLIQLLALFLLAGDIWFAVVYSEPNNTFFLVFAVVIAAALLLASLWFYPLVGRFQNPFSTQLKNSFLLAFAQLPKTLLALLVWAITFGIPFVLFDVFQYFGWIWLLCGLSLPMYLTAKLFRKTLQIKGTPDDREQD